jgi:hypothetical protein
VAISDIRILVSGLLDRAVLSRFFASLTATQEGKKLAGMRHEKRKSAIIRSTVVGGRGVKWG